MALRVPYDQPKAERSKCNAQRQIGGRCGALLAIRGQEESNAFA